MNRELAAQLARLSELAYEDLDTVRAALRTAAVDLIDVDDTQAYTVAWGDMAAVAFRGTQVTENWSWPDVKTNLLQGKKPFPGHLGAEVHGGYFRAIMAVLLTVQAFVQTQRGQGVPIYFTGHSLGGVLATLAAAKLKVDATYTFGAPRCGNATFARILEGRNVHRFVYASDIAPSYPHPLLGYRHGGERWQLSKRGVLTPGGGWRDKFHFPVAKGVLDHRVANYVNGL